MELKYINIQKIKFNDEEEIRAISFSQTGSEKTTLLNSFLLI